MSSASETLYVLEPAKGFANLEPSRKGFVTNYPNFQHWKKVTSADMLAPKPLIIYVHVPFCIQRCAYCYYRTVNLKGAERNERIERYVKALCREIEMTSQYFQLKDRPVISIYFGGGTPTLLEEDQFHRIVECLRNHLNIENPEFTVEAEPVTLTQRKADILKGIKVNRISMGIQSLSDDIIKQSNRLDTEKKALKAIDIARATAAVVNIDLLSGLAGETPETWAYTVNRAIETEVESITVYKMELYANTEYYKEIRNDALVLPSDEQELEFMRYALGQFEQAQYLPWSFFTFTKQGRYEHLYASRMWRGVDCYPFGVSAFGSLGQWVFQNTNEEEKYVEVVEAGEIPINRGYWLTNMDQMIRTVMLELKLVRMDLKEFQGKYGFKLQSLCASTLKQLEADGFISFSDEEIRLTPKGILYGDHVGKSVAKGLMQIG
jgi:oxygen-independent coproporphyrinogen-3 oxidase